MFVNEKNVKTFAALHNRKVGKDFLAMLEEFVQDKLTKASQLSDKVWHADTAVQVGIKRK